MKKYKVTIWYILIGEEKKENPQTEKRTSIVNAQNAFEAYKKADANYNTNKGVLKFESSKFKQ